MQAEREKQDTGEVALWWFIPLLLVVLRALAATVGAAGESMPGRQRAMICGFGIRGIGSVYYLMLAIRHGVAEPLAQEPIALTLGTVALSIAAHGVSVHPPMARYMLSESRSAPIRGGSP